MVHVWPVIPMDQKRLPKDWEVDKDKSPFGKLGKAHVFAPQGSKDMASKSPLFHFPGLDSVPHVLFTFCLEDILAQIQRDKRLRNQRVGTFGPEFAFLKCQSYSSGNPAGGLEI